MTLMDRSIHRFHHYQRRGQHLSRLASPWALAGSSGVPLGLGLGNLGARPQRAASRYSWRQTMPRRGPGGRIGGSRYHEARHENRGRLFRLMPLLRIAPSRQPIPTSRDFSGICMPRSNGYLAGGTHYRFGFTPNTCSRAEHSESYVQPDSHRVAGVQRIEDPRGEEARAFL
jgi:hypothetical protein